MRSRALAFNSAAMLTLAAVMRTGFGFALTVFAVKALGAAEFGRYSLVMAYGNMLLFSYSGAYPVVITRLVQARGLPDAERELARSNLVVAAALITVPGALLLLAAGAVAAGGSAGTGALGGLALPVTLIVVCQLVTVFGTAVLEGLGRMRTIAMLPLLGVGILSGWLALAVFQRRTVLLAEFLNFAIVAFAIEALIAMLLVAWLCRSLRPGRRSLSDAGGLVREGFNLQAAKIVSFAVEPAVKSILNHFVGPASIAVYDFANRAATGMQAIFGAYSRLFLQIGREASAERMASTRQAAHYTWAMYLYTAGLVAVLVIGPASRWMKLDATALGLGFLIATLANWLMVIGTPLFLSLIGFGEFRFVLRNQLIQAVVTIGCAALLVPTLGVVGAFLGVLLAMLINLPLIERRFLSHESGHEGLWQQALAMRGRLGLALVLLLIPGLALAQVEDFRLYWGLTAASVLLIALCVWREPLARTTIRRGGELIARRSAKLAGHG